MACDFTLKLLKLLHGMVGVMFYFCCEDGQLLPFAVVVQRESTVLLSGQRDCFFDGFFQFFIGWVRVRVLVDVRPHLRVSYLFIDLDLLCLGS